MTRAWTIWLVTSITFAVYAALGHVVSRTDVVGIVLQPGQTAEVPVFRLANDSLRLELRFRPIQNEVAAALGNPSTRSDWRKDGKLVYEIPGSAVKIASWLPSSSSPVVYEAMPMSSYGSTGISRHMTSDLAIDHGVWRWPPLHQNLPLAAGFSRVKFEVIKVEAPLIGEKVEIRIIPPLGIKSAYDNVGWLWWSLFWPFVIPIFLLWSVVLASITYGRRKTHA